jgi:hypothetical protein
MDPCLDLYARVTELLPGATLLHVASKNGNFFNWPYSKLVVDENLTDQFCLRVWYDAAWLDEEDAEDAVEAFLDRAHIVVSLTDDLDGEEGVGWCRMKLSQAELKELFCRGVRLLRDQQEAK